MKKILSSLFLGLALMWGGSLAWAQASPATPAPVAAAAAEAKAPAAAEAAAPAAPGPNKGDTAWLTGPRCSSSS